MATTKNSYKVLLEDKEGNKFYPHTMVDVVHVDENKTIQNWIDEKEEQINTATSTIDTYTKYAKENGDYAKVQGDYAQQVADSVNGRLQTIETKNTEQDQAIANKVTLDSIPSNFDLLESKVIQDGVVFAGEGSYTNTNLSVIDFYCKMQGTVNLSIGDVKQTKFIEINGFTVGLDASGVWYCSGRGIPYTQIGVGYFEVGNVMLEVSLKNNVCTINVKNNIKESTRVFQLSNGTNNTIIINQKNIQSIMSQAYNRPLTPQEINHNLSVYDNPPSLSHVKATDSTGQQRNISFGSNEDAVEMATGRTLRQEYMGLANALSQEFVSADGSPLTVNDGIESRLVGARIEGQTIKCIYADNDWITSENTITGWSEANVMIGSVAQVKPNSTYVLIVDIKENTKNGEYMMVNPDSMSCFTTKINIAIGKTGIVKAIISTKSDLASLTRFMSSNNSSSSVTGKIIFKRSVIEISNIDLVNSYVPFGLSSTEAIIQNNGTKYSFFETLIYGKTRILKAPKGTQNWTEISPSEVRDTTTYDYKLDSVGGDLGSVGSASDYVDRAKKVNVFNTKEVVLNSECVVSDLQNIEGRTCVRFRISISGLSSTVERTNILSQYFKTNPTVYYDASDEEGICSTSNGILIRMLKTKLTTPDIQGFKAWLQSNPITIRYQLATPIEVPLTDEEFKTYDAFKKLILCSKVGEVADTFEIKEDGSGNHLGLTKIKVINQDDTIIVNTDVVADGFTAFTISSISDFKTNSKMCVCDKFVNALSPQDAGEWIYFGRSITIKISNSKLSTQDVAGFKTWLQSNPITVRYQLATPIVTHIPKELVPAILTQQTNIFSVGEGVKANNFSVKVPLNAAKQIDVLQKAVLMLQQQVVALNTPK